MGSKPLPSRYFLFRPSGIKKPAAQHQHRPIVLGKPHNEDIPPAHYKINDHFPHQQVEAAVSIATFSTRIFILKNKKKKKAANTNHGNNDWHPLHEKCRGVRV